MFDRSARYYDAIYHNMGKDYPAEAALLHSLAQQHLQTAGNTLLDVACGTGQHLAPLGQYYQVEGLDLDAGMLALAGEKNPGLPLHHANMLTFALPRQFAVITCLFSSIGYVQTIAGLEQALENMARHLQPGGVLLVEPWFAPADWNTGKVHALLVDQPDLKIARMSISERQDNLSYFTFHYLVADRGEIIHFTELHQLGLFTPQDYQSAFLRAGLEANLDPTGLDGRGLWIGLKKKA